MDEPTIFEIGSHVTSVAITGTYNFPERVIDMILKKSDVLDKSLFHLLENIIDFLPSYLPTYIAIGCVDNSVRVWNVEEKKELHIMKGHTGIVKSVLFSQNADYIISISNDKTMRIWDVDNGNEIENFEFGEISVCAAVNNYIALVDYSGNIRVLDIKTRAEINNFENGSKVNSISISADGKYVATTRYGMHNGKFRHYVVLWNTESGEEEHQLEGHHVSIQTLSFSGDGLYIASGSSSSGLNRRNNIIDVDEVENEDKINNNMIIWDVESGKKILTKKHKSQINSICFSSDNKYIAFGDADGNVIVLNAISGEEIKKFYIGRRIIVSHVSFFQDDKYITTACGNNVRIWKL